MKRLISVTGAIALAMCLAAPATASVNVLTPNIEDAFIPTNNDFKSDLEGLYSTAADGDTQVVSGNLEFTSSYRADFYFHGAESGYNNSFFVNGVNLKTEVDGVHGQVFNGPGEFLGGTVISGGSNLGINPGGTTGVIQFVSPVDTYELGQHEFGFLRDADGYIADDGRYYFVLDDNGAGPDDNHDDMIISMQLTAIPEPTSLLVWSGLVGLACVRRRRK